jgi:hypothetical protein
MVRVSIGLMALFAASSAMAAESVVLKFVDPSTDITHAGEIRVVVSALDFNSASGKADRVELSLPDGKKVEGKGPEFILNTSTWPEGEDMVTGVAIASDGRRSQPENLRLRVANGVCRAKQQAFAGYEKPEAFTGEKKIPIVVTGTENPGHLALSYNVSGSEYHTWIGLQSPTGRIETIVNFQGSSDYVYGRQFTFEGIRESVRVFDYATPVGNSANSGIWHLIVRARYKDKYGVPKGFAVINSASLSLVQSCDLEPGSWIAKGGPFKLDPRVDKESCYSTYVSAEGKGAPVRLQLTGTHPNPLALEGTLKFEKDTKTVFRGNALKINGMRFEFSEFVSGFSPNVVGRWTFCIRPTDGVTYSLAGSVEGWGLSSGISRQ